MKIVKRLLVTYTEVIFHPQVISGQVKILKRYIARIDNKEVSCHSRTEPFKLAAALTSGIIKAIPSALTDVPSIWEKSAHVDESWNDYMNKRFKDITEEMYSAVL